MEVVGERMWKGRFSSLTPYVVVTSADAIRKKPVRLLFCHCKRAGGRAVGHLHTYDNNNMHDDE